MIGIKDIAQMAGVSVATVSNALNGKKNVGDATRKKILDLCKEHGYAHAAINQEESSGNGGIKTILFNFSDFDRNFYLEIINGVNSYVREHGYDLMICTRVSCEKFMKSGLTNGCIILDMAMNNSLLRSVACKEYPIITLDRYVEHPYIKGILINNYDAMAELTRGLVRRGYRRFDFIGGPEKTDDNMERYGAFTDVLEKNRIRFPSERYHTGDYRQKSGYMITRMMALSGNLPDCIVCANDLMAIGAMKALNEAGYRVPEDVAVTGFDDCMLAGPMGLTTVSIPNYERGYIAAQYLIEGMKNDSRSGPVKINAKVKWRGSVKDKLYE
ncbi:MAG: LacI family transcriptional regulator [Lachnospiraceae bacterium]|nr:LacI family transcriptional regulator [Lachnospiraceae bacterium]